MSISSDLNISKSDSSSHPLDPLQKSYSFCKNILKLLKLYVTGIEKLEKKSREISFLFFIAAFYKVQVSSVSIY